VHACGERGVCASALGAPRGAQAQARFGCNQAHAPGGERRAGAGRAPARGAARAGAARSIFGRLAVADVASERDRSHIARAPQRRPGAKRAQHDAQLTCRRSFEQRARFPGRCRCRVAPRPAEGCCAAAAPLPCACRADARCHMRRRAGAAALLAVLLAACALPLLTRAEAPTEHCVWRVTLRAAPEGDLEEALWSGAASVEARACTALQRARARLRASSRAARARRALFTFAFFASRMSCVRLCHLSRRCADAPRCAPAAAGGQGGMPGGRGPAAALRRLRVAPARHTPPLVRSDRRVRHVCAVVF
jgi:hypothetical protein